MRNCETFCTVNLKKSWTLFRFTLTSDLCVRLTRFRIPLLFCFSSKSSNSKWVDSNSFRFVAWADSSETLETERLGGFSSTSSTSVSLFVDSSVVAVSLEVEILMSSWLLGCSRIGSLADFFATAFVSVKSTLGWSASACSSASGPLSTTGS